MKKIKIAQIGMNTYSHSKEIFASLKKQRDIFEIVGYVLPESERERLPSKVDILKDYKELTLEEVLNNPEIEAVTIETDEIYLTKYALMAVKAGKHIHMEKPGGRELEDFEELIDIARNNGKVLHFGYMYRYNPFISELIQKVRNGELGDIISVEAQMNVSHPIAFRQWHETFKGGVMFFLGCHLIDLVLLIKGIPNDVIPLNRSTGKENVYTEDFGMAVLKYDNGISFAKVNAAEIDGFKRRQLVVSGTKGTVEIKPLEEGVSDIPYGMRTYKKESYMPQRSDNGVKVSSEVFARYDSMMKAFGKYVRGEEKNPYTLDYELDLYKIILKACARKD
ncbi:MAG: Gfo/Idh/MocA family oxidoreductase [Ruminococcaceae bacterium]|nr:Gfo/Idh/MocA family oxidoreductase [Oscillospiraceae bacterium]